MSLQIATTALARDLPNTKAPSVIQRTQDLQNHVRSLAALPESDAPVVSCYLDLAPGRANWDALLERRIKLLRRITPSPERASLDGAVDRIRSFLKTELRTETRGVAVFARVGRDPYLCGLQFEVPTPTSVSLDTVPSIYHLIELKDTFDRYLVLLSTSDSARIFEVHLGAVTSELWLQQPELRQRVGREWTRLHYQNHRRDRDRSFIREKIRALERLVLGRGYAHLILAGDPQRLAVICKELPRTIRERVVDVVATPSSLNDKEVVKATLSSFVEQEERDSQSLVQQLFNELRRDGLAISGAANSLQVLRRGQADALLLARGWETSRSWSCGVCTWTAVGEVQPEVCAECGSIALREHDAREELVRLAEQTGCHVELVGESKLLDELDGVGCLLRFSDWEHPPGDFRATAGQS